MPKRQYVYFVEPTDSFSNEIMGKRLSEENSLENMLCEDGQRHDLWRCSYKFLLFLQKSQQFFNIKVRFWWQEGNGKIRAYQPVTKNKKTKKASRCSK